MKIPSHLDGLSKRDLIRYILSLESHFDEQSKEIEDLKKRLLAYENAHTPPSQQRRYPKREKSNNNVGAPKGHKGITRETPEPNRFRELKLCSCPDCGKRLGRPRSILKKIIEDLPDPHPLKITEFTINRYFCNHCKKKIIPQDPELPEEGIFGPNLLAQITLMKYEDRLPHRKIVNTLNRQYGLHLTPATVLDITRRVTDKLQGTYEQIKQDVKESMHANADETGMKVRGNKYWSWVFVTLTSVLFLIRPSRGQKVIKEALGGNYKGILGCDGWTSYPKCVDNLQRCWAHLLREAKWLAEKYEGQSRIMYKNLCRIFRRVKKVTVSTATSWRTKTYNWCVKEMKRVIGECRAYTELREFATKLENGMRYWFTCVLHPEIDATNNKAENALREMVIQRKISSLWNEKGVRIKETIMSVLATWNLRSLNTFSMLRQTLSS